MFKLALKDGYPSQAALRVAAQEPPAASVLYVGANFSCKTATFGVKPRGFAHPAQHLRSPVGRDVTGSTAGKEIPEQSVEVVHGAGRAFTKSSHLSVSMRKTATSSSSPTERRRALCDAAV